MRTIVWWIKDISKQSPDLVVTVATHCAALCEKDLCIGRRPVITWQTYSKSIRIVSPKLKDNKDRNQFFRSSKKIRQNRSLSIVHDICVTSEWIGSDEVDFKNSRMTAGNTARCRVLLLRKTKPYQWQFVYYSGEILYNFQWVLTELFAFQLSLDVKETLLIVLLRLSLTLFSSSLKVLVSIQSCEISQWCPLWSPLCFGHSRNDTID